MLSFAEFTESTVQLSQLGKRTVCEIERGPTDNPPILVWKGCGEDDLYLKAFKADEYVSNTLRKALSEALIEFGKPRYIAVIAEAYLKSGKDLDELNRTYEGDLQNSFLNDFDASIEEIISIVSFDLEGNVSLNISKYSYDDTGLPVFEDTGEVEVKPYTVMASDGNANQTIKVIEEFVKFVRICINGN